MKFDNEFTVQAPIDEVWTTLLDVERVAPCMPGAEVLERSGENAYKVGIRVKVGPISMLYRGQVEITERDDASHRATMRAKAREARGQGTADAHVHMRLAEQPEGSHATLETDLQLSGRAAAMGRGVIGDVAENLVATFAGNLAGMLAGKPAEAPAGAAAAEPAPAGASAPAAEPAPAGASAPAAGDGAPGAPAPAGPAPAPTTAGAPTPPPAGVSAPPPSGAGAPPPPPPGPSGPSGGDSLPVGQIAASVIAGRLRNPRNLLIATGAVGLTFGAIGYAIGRAR